MQELNPIPFPVVVANCMAWVAYAIVSKDPYVFLANDPGLLLGLFYTFSAYGYADAKVLAPILSCPYLLCLEYSIDSAQHQTVHVIESNDAQES